MSKLSDLILVLWKNWIVIKQKHILSLIEILLPCICMLFLLGIRQIVDSENYENITTWKNCNITTSVETVAFAPNNSFENSIMDWLRKTQNIASTGFPSEDEMVKYLVSHETSMYNGSIIFENKSSNSIFDISLKIRLPTKQIKWNTDRMFPLFQTFQPRKKNDLCGSNPNYETTGFLYLQYILTEGIIIQLNASSEDFFNQTTVGLNRQPFPPYNNDPMVLVIQNQLPFILVFSFVLCALQIVKDIVQEKEQRLKEAMKMMGLRNWIIWLGWFIKYFIFILISISIMTLFLCVNIGDKGSVVGYTNPFILFLFFLAYTFATISFCFLISTFFSKANTGAVAGGALFFLSYIPYSLISPRYGTLSWGIKIVTCLISNIALAFGGQVLGMFEGQGTGIQWHNINRGSSIDDDFTFLHIILMLILDTIIYSLLTWYIETVFPGEYGVPQIWYFPFTKSYWCGTTQVKCMAGSLGPAHEEEQYFEQEPNNLKPGIQIKNLYKEFKGKKKVAVDDLTLNMYEGQITALLGHNGAGKTTTISMITGLITPSNGTAIVNGYDICNDIKNVQSSLGICPQHDILFEMLTVEEHLKFFAQLKGYPKTLLDSEVNKMIQSITLEDKRNVLSKNLSGGMKRRLSLGIALIGDSKVVILDEPSSGLDPNARRQVWSVLEKHRKGRTMLLTTHFMDEADHLGDRIAIISDGVLKCCGSSLFLKSKYGAGYHLVIVKTADCNVNNVSQLLKSYIPEATMESNVGAELSYLLPHESSCHFENLFNMIHSKQTALGISNYGVSVTTMEEVFLKVSENQNSKPNIDSHTYTNGNVLENCTSTTVPINSTFETTFKPSVSKKTGLQQFYAMFLKKMLYSWRNKFMSVSQILVPLAFTIIALIVVKTFPTQNDFPSLLLSPEKYGQNYIPFSSSLNLTPEEASITKFYQDESLNDVSFININKKFDSPDITQYLGYISTKDREKYNEHYMISADFGETLPNHYIAYFNGQSFHSSAISLAVMTSAFLRHFHKPTSKISYINYPLPITQSEAGRSLNTTAFTISVMILFSISFMVATFSIFLIEERCTKSKHLQYISGVYPFNFWASAYIWDLICFFITSLCLIITFVCFDIKAYFEDGRSAEILLLFFLYSTAVLPLMYLLSFLFKTPTSGFVWLALLNLVTGLATVISVNILSIAQLDLLDVADTLYWIFIVISPQFCLGQALIDFYNNNVMLAQCAKLNIKGICKSDFASYNKNYLGWEGKGIGKPLTFLFMQNVISSVLLILVDCSIPQKICYSLKKFCTKDKIQNIKNNRNTSENVMSIDSDVVEEQDRIDSFSQLHNDVIVMKNVTKLYGSFMAVNNISVGIPAGECFGLLGINGAGKTSTFKMLTGDERISSGKIYINKLSLESNIRQIQRYIGYCPQFDALIECLTAREILNMFALIRGIPTKIIPQTVNDLIEELMLQKYADKQVKTYSGGNKRKLSTAVALIGDSPVVLLDEPTTGMDPGTRRNLWNTLIKVRNTGRTLILTSHSMDECEALCTKIAIMVNGQFRCFGSIQHLKSKFGDGYSLIAKVGHRDPNAEQQDLHPLMNFIENSLPGSTLKDMHEGLIHYQIPKNTDISWAQMFGTLEQAKNLFNVEAYSLGQTSLEQVFINFARSQVTSN